MHQTRLLGATHRRRAIRPSSSLAWNILRTLDRVRLNAVAASRLEGQDNELIARDVDDHQQSTHTADNSW